MHGKTREILRNEAYLLVRQLGRLPALTLVSAWLSSAKPREFSQATQQMDFLRSRQ
jgi:hypothetical protein